MGLGACTALCPGNRQRWRRLRGRPSSSTPARLLGNDTCGHWVAKIYGNVIGGSSGTAPVHSNIEGNSDRRLSVSAGDTEWHHNAARRGWQMVSRSQYLRFLFDSGSTGGSIGSPGPFAGLYAHREHQEDGDGERQRHRHPPLVCTALLPCTKITG